MPGELYQIYAEKYDINKKRTAIKGSGFNDGYYWSSREYSSGSEYYVYLGNGGIYGLAKSDDLTYVLGFLALEV